MRLKPAEVGEQNFRVLRNRQEYVKQFTIMQEQLVRRAAGTARSADSYVGPAKVVMVTRRKPRQALKRVFDILICGAALPFIMPLGLLLALLIMVDSKGAAIYRHERIGKNGKPFALYKFRTMVEDADKLLDACLESDPELAAEWQENHKLKNDPRLTRIGDFLRKTSLDELPQIINILKGEMTLVGPRPIVSAETPKYGRHFSEYCESHPGLTGLWQTSGRNNTTYSQRVALDHYYLTHWSIWLDLWILVRTIPVALGGRGAY